MSAAGYALAAAAGAASAAAACMCVASLQQDPADPEPEQRQSQRKQLQQHHQQCQLQLRRCKLVRDLEWVWRSPSIFSSEADCPGLSDSACAAIAEAPDCQRWLAALDTHPTPLINFLVDEHGHDEGTALGFYFAQLLEFWLRFCPGLGASGLLVNQPIKLGAQTVGQLKYLFHRPAFPALTGPLQLHHWESSVKFFIRAAPSCAAVMGATAAAGGASPALRTDWVRRPKGGPDQAAVRRAAGGSDPAALTALIEGWSGADLEAAVDGSGKSPLHQAAWRGDIANVIALLDRGCSVEAISTGEFSFGKTPLFFAITRSRDEVVSLLLSRGASARIVNNKGQTPRSLGATHLLSDTLRLLSEHEEQECVGWRNYRKTHSDGLRYGDLDPRFLEHALEPSDVVTPLCVNPTTRLSRKGNFHRNNFDGGERKQATLELSSAVLSRAQASVSCLGLYVGPSLHENLAWRVAEAKRKMELAQPGGAGYGWLAAQPGLLAPGSASDGNGMPEAVRPGPESAFVCKGYLFELLAPDGLTPAAGESQFCCAVSHNHLQGWWCEWPQLKTRFEMMSCAGDPEEVAAKERRERWAILTKRHWLAPAVGRSKPGQSTPAKQRHTAVVVIDGEPTVGIESLPTFSTRQLATKLRPHFERALSTRPQPLLLAFMLQDDAVADVWVEHSRGFVVVEGWAAQAAPMLSDGVPLVNKKRDGQHDTMIAPSIGAVTAIRRQPRKQRKVKKQKPELPPVEAPLELKGKQGVEAVAVLRVGLGTGSKLGATAKKGGRAVRVDRELWRRQLVVMLLEMEGEAAGWVWGCICTLEPTDKTDRSVSSVLLDALGDSTSRMADLKASSAVGTELAAQCLRNLCHNPATGGWLAATTVRFVLAVVGEPFEDRADEALAELRWSDVLAVAGGAGRVAHIAEVLLSHGGATELEAAARLATKAGVSAALPLSAIVEVSLALLKRGSFKQLKMLVDSMNDKAEADALKAKLLVEAPPRATQRLAASLGMEPPPQTARRWPLQRDGDGVDKPCDLPWLTVSEGMKVTVAVSAEECEAAVQELVASLGVTGMCGLDTEWADNSGGRPICVLLQIASATHCVLVRLESIGAEIDKHRSSVRDCSSLVALMADPSVALAGVGISRDAALLESEWGLNCAGTVDLVALAQAVGVVQGRHGVGLASLSRLMIGCGLRKSKHLRCGDWRADPLSAEQIEYAALDAIAGQRILAALCEHGRQEKATRCVMFCEALAPGMIVDADHGAMPDRNIRVTTTQLKDAQELRAWVSEAAVGESREFELSQSRRLHLHRTCIVLEAEGYSLAHESSGEPRAASQTRMLTVTKTAASGAQPQNATTSANQAAPSSAVQRKKRGNQGNWVCRACGADVFARKKFCFKCKAPKPEDGE